jgi:hypothetical protein
MEKQVYLRPGMFVKLIEIQLVEAKANVSSNYASAALTNVVTMRATLELLEDHLQSMLNGKVKAYHVT